MPSILIYTTTTCPYCLRAKALFKKKGVPYQEINLNQQADLRDEMIDKAGGRRSVPQIFINQRHIGGCDDLYQLEAEGKLDALLQDA